MDIAREQMTAGILAGGEGRRLGGVDKGWYEVEGQALVARTIERVAPQAGPLIISANRSLARYRALGYPVQSDDSDDSRGPLAGMAAVLKAASTPYVLFVPVDTPYLPLDLADRLATGMKKDSDIAVARVGDQIHALHALVRRSLLDDLQAALFSGTRRVSDWQEGLGRVVVDWDSARDFANINSEEDARLLHADAD
ncbi:MAG: molybdenum cofactor guanylyltransferase [Salinisphaera sp.]|jgi:molybdopterin-guanine dinucleotide biosynthesis protein A|nr:molybdenum cofactor guanylyltransferase [Salinisphaera sp.]